MLTASTHFPASRPPARVLHIEGKAFAFGLEFETPTARQRVGVKKQAHSQASKNGSSYVAVRNSAHPLFGMASLPPGERGPSLMRPIYSAALSLAAATSGTFLGVWVFVDGSCWLCASGSTGILPEGDVILANEQVAQEQFLAMRDRMGSKLRYIYAPKHWGADYTQNARSDDLRLLLTRRPTGRLEATQHPSFAKSMLQVGMAVSAMALTGYLFWHQRHRSMVADIATLQAPPPPPPPALKWHTLEDGILACLQAADVIAYGAGVAAGWHGSGFECKPDAGDGPGTLAVTLSASAGAPLSAVQGLPGFQVVDANTVKVALPTQTLPMRSTSTGFMPDRMTRQRLLEFAQFSHGSLTADASSQWLAGVLKPTFLGITWSISTKAPPALWLNFVRGLAPSELVELNYRLDGRVYELKGRSYVEP